MASAWDQVLAFGEYQHCTVDGTPKMTVFDASKCRYMLDDFATRKNDLFYDRAHEVVDLTDPEGEPLDLDGLETWARGSTGRYGMGEGDGKALAWSDALCMVVAGQVVRYAAHSTAPDREPSIAELRRSDGSLPGDGVYARRAEVTPLGADPRDGLSVYRYTSPYYISMRDGWRLLNLTATNDPRMEGVALAYSRTGRERLAMQRIAMASGTHQVIVNWSDGRPTERGYPSEAEAIKAAGSHWPPSSDIKSVQISGPNGWVSGWGPGSHVNNRAMENKMDPAEQMTAAMKAAGCAEEDAPEMKMSKMAAHIRKMEDDSEAMRRKMEDSDKEKESMRRKMEEDEKARGAAEAKPFEGKEGKEEEKKEKEAMSRKLHAAEEKVAMMQDEIKKLHSSADEFQAMQRESKKATATSWAKNAVAMRRVKPDRKGTAEDTIAWLADKRVADPQGAEELLCDEGTFGPSEAAAMENYIEHGAGRGAPLPRDGGLDEDDKMSRAISAELVSAKKEGVDMSKVKDTYSFAMQRINSRSASNQPARHLRAVGGR